MLRYTPSQFTLVCDLLSVPQTRTAAQMRTHHLQPDVAMLGGGIPMMMTRYQLTTDSLLTPCGENYRTYTTCTTSRQRDTSAGAPWAWDCACAMAACYPWSAAVVLSVILPGPSMPIAAAFALTDVAR